MAKITRRKFLDLSRSAILGGAASVGASQVLGGVLNQAQAAATGNSADSEVRVIPTYCDVCFMTCGINVIVKKGKAIKIQGNPLHPLSRGKLCPRGTAGLGQLYDSDRIKTPLIRRTVLGVQSFEKVSWDEALDFAAEKMNHIKHTYGPQSLALLKHGKGAAPFEDLWHAIGSATEGHPSYAQCRGARDIGWGLTFGKDPGGIERIGLDKAKVVAFIGAHLGENMHNTTVQDFTTGLREGSKNIVVDPRFSTAASKAKYWLPIKPGTDTALLLAWIHVLIYENLYDKQFIEQHAIGFDQLKEHVKTMSPEWAANYTNLPADSIRQTARELGNAIPNALLYPGRRFAWYGDDTQRARAMAIINALLGSWGRESGVFIGQKFPLPKFDKYPDYGLHRKPVHALDVKSKYPLGNSTPVQDIVEASIPGLIDRENKEALVKGWLVYSTNIIRSVPDRALVEKAIENLDLLVVVDTMPSEITGYADVVLPDTTYLERYDGLNNPEWRTPFLSIRQPVVKPLYQSKPSWWIAQQLANRLWVEETFLFNDYEEVIEYQLNKIGSSIKDINEKGGVLTKPPLPPEPQSLLKFKTPSGKVELFSKRMEDAGFDPMPVFVDKEEVPDGYFRLLYGRTPQHTFTRTVNNKILMELFPENEIWVNKRIAELYNLKNGDYVMLVNQVGVKSNRIKIRSTERIRQDCVYMAHGFGREDRRLSRAFNKGADDNGLLSDYVTDPIMGSTGSQVNYVTFVK
jgi:thiosulfate reductase/polysulfide reductase chain A